LEVRLKYVTKGDNLIQFISVFLINKIRNIQH